LTTDDTATIQSKEQPLRANFLSALAEPDGDRTSIEAFINADPAAAIRLWFGDELLKQVQDAEHLRRLLDWDVAEMDELLNQASNGLLHHPRVIELESNWLGIHWLAGALTADGMTVLRVLDCRWSELARDLERAADFDQSTLFELVYNQEYGMPGGLPFALLIGLYEVQHRVTRERPTDDIGILRRLTAVAAAAFCPVIVGVRPAMLGADSFGDLERRASLAALFRSAEFARFRSFRELPDARFVGLVAPRVLLRAPYRGRDVGDCGFRFSETVTDSGKELVWGNGALALGQICLRAFNDFRWLASIRGTVADELAGGVVVDLPTPDFETDPPDTVLKFPLEINLTETLERDLTEAGVISIRRCKETPYVAVFNLPSAHRAQGQYTTEIARANEQLGSMLNYIFCVGRFAHYIKVISREFIGSYSSASDCQDRLTRWLSRYCTSGDDVSYEMRARFPLQSARVKVQDVVGQPGAFECTVLLKPHLQLDQAISEFQLVTIVQGVERKL